MTKSSAEYLAGRLDAIDTSVQSLTQTLLKGNGQPAITERLTRVEVALTVAAENYKEAAVLAKANADQVDVVAGSVIKLSSSLDAMCKDMNEHPTIHKIMAKNPIKALALVGGAIVSGVSIWIVLYAFVQLPGVENWLHGMLKLP